MQKLNILINCFHMPPIKKGAGGAGMYVKSILEPLSKRVNLRIIVSDRNKKDYSATEAKSIVLPELSYTLLENWFNWCDLYYDPQNGLTPQEIPLEVPTVCSIYDLQHTVFPKFFPPEILKARNKDYGYAIKKADAVITISEYEKRNIEKFVPNSNIHVIYLSGFLYDKVKAESPDILSGTYKMSDYYLYPAVSWIHKNHYRLFESIYLINKKRKAKKEDPIKLMLTGSKHTLSNNIQADLLEIIGSENIKFSGFISDDELAIEMQICKGMIFPSLYEGFGIPVVDAINFGTPLLTTKQAALPEVTNDSVSIIENPFDTMSLVKAIETFDKNISNGTLKRKKTSGESKFSIARIVDELMACFQETIDFKKINSPSKLRIQTRDTSISDKDLTVIVDIPFSVTQKNINELISSSLFKDLNTSADIILHVELGKNTSELEIEKDVNIVYYSEDLKGYKPHSLEFMLRSTIVTRYLIYIDFEEFEFLDFNKLNIATQYLEKRNDLVGIKLVPDKNKKVVWHKSSNKLDSIEIIEGFEEGIKNEKIIYFKNHLLKTWICENGGMIGSYKRMSHAQKEKIISI